MPDSEGMNITHHISAAFLVGALISVASPVHAGEAGVGSVELIPFPEEVIGGGNLVFSSDGALHLLSSYRNRNQFVHQYRNREWTLIRQDVTAPAGIRGVAASPEAYRIVLSNFERVDVVADGVVRTLPRDWEYTDEHGRTRGVDGSVSGGLISADGQVVTMAGQAYDTYKSDSLYWTAESGYLNISDSLPRGEVSYLAGFPSADGSVIAFSSTFAGAHNNIRQLGSSDGDVWVWEDGEVVPVPDVEPGYDVLMRLEDVSGDGNTVIGSARGVWRPFGAFDQPLTDQSHGLINGPRLAWIWTRGGGTHQLIDGRFREMSLRSVDHDASTALGYGTLNDGSDVHFLWFRNDQVLLLNDVLNTLNISIDADWYSFNQISDDGTRLMGHASVNDVRHAIIVTIPDLTP